MNTNTTFERRSRTAPRNAFTGGWDSYGPVVKEKPSFLKRMFGR